MISYSRTHIPRSIAYVYPLRYVEIATYVKTLKVISHTALQCKYNIRYAESRALIHALQHDELISVNYDLGLKGYRVVEAIE